MQFRDLKAQYVTLKNDIDKGIQEVIESSQFISGPKVKELEDLLANYVGRKHCISCANGTDALELVLRAWGIGEGDAVFVPSFTFMSTAEVVALLGAHPYFVDISLDTFNMSPESLETAILKAKSQARYELKAVIPVDLYGLPADYTSILPITKKYGLKILEDGAQGFGGMIGDQRACSFGDASTTSFFPAKPLGCYGDGGAVFTDDDDMDTMIRSLCVHGKGRMKYENIRIGRNSRLDSLQAGILIPKFKAFADHEIKSVNNAARLYTELLDGVVKTPCVPHGFLSSWAQYTILLPLQEKRDNLKAKLYEQGIPSMVYYPCGLHLQKAFEYCGYKKGDLPSTERACACVLSLPMHPYITEKDIKTVVSAIRNIL